MKSKKPTSSLLIAILTVIISICAIFTFVPMKFGTTTYTGVWGNIGISSSVYGGLYAEYDIVGDANSSQVVNSMEKIKSLLGEQGYQSTNVFAVDNSKVRVEIGYPKTVTNSFSAAYSALSSIAVGSFEFRSSSGDDYVAVVGSKHVKEINVADYNGTTYLTIEFNDAGEEQFKSLCAASTTVYVYMGDNLQTSFSVSNLSNYSQIQLSVADYASAKDFYYKAMYGSLEIQLNGDTMEINTMSAPLGLGSNEGASVVLIELLVLIALLIVAGFVYMAVKFGIASLLLMPIMMLNAIISCWIFAGISMFEINVPSLISIILSLSIVFGGSICYMSRIAEEYKQGKTIDASIEAGTKKAKPALLVTSAVMIALFAVLAIITKGELASASLVLTIAGALNILTNVLLLPWFVNIYNRTNKEQGKPFRFVQGGENND